MTVDGGSATAQQTVRNSENRFAPAGGPGFESAALSLGFGLTFEDLYAPAGLARLDAAFAQWLSAADADLATHWTAARTALSVGHAADTPQNFDESALLIALAPHLEDFLAEVFGVREPLTTLKSAHETLAPLFTAKRLFVQRQAVKGITPDQAAEIDGPLLEQELAAAIGVALPLDDLTFARTVLRWMDEEATSEPQLDMARRYAAWATLTEHGRARWQDSVLFRVPRKLDPHALVHTESVGVGTASAVQHPWTRRRARDGFTLTDAGCDLTGALDQANYCIWCHKQGKDSCSKGLKDKKTGAFQASPFGITLAGCPLEEKISEMHTLKSQGHPLGALAVAIVDNPMVAGTGHRICNDCMKACIYQKQDPVDIPQAETRTLKDILSLPWGFEIYSLLTRWNPLNLRNGLAKPDSGKRVLVAGLGPAGYTLAHYLLNQGHTVIGIDGLKIEPIDPALSGVDAYGRRAPFRPIRDVSEIYESLDDRVLAGFGGVAEYGITVRWNKNFLKVIRLLLERRPGFAMHGGVRLGGTLTIEDAFAQGFDHVALAMGAGRPTILDLPNGLARGVRQASDFLMALQLTGAAKANSLANLQLRLPVVVIGGGLTAIDTATESRAYYVVQVERFLRRYELLAAERGEDRVRAGFTDEDRLIADEFLAHGRAIRDERAVAQAEGRAPSFDRLIDSWGGVTVAYRRRLIDSPSYTLNHEEVEKALEEGIRFAEGITPTAVTVDDFGHASALEGTYRAADGSVTSVSLPARSILVAAGTKPNTVLARESDGAIRLDGRYFQAFDEAGTPVTPETVSKPAAAHVLAEVHTDGRAVSFFGDLHPSFAGNVVKAMGGSKQGWPIVHRMLDRRPASPEPTETFLGRLRDDLRATVRAVNRLTPTIVEVVVHAPAAARGFKPGQFYRLQNFETLAPQVGETVLAMEGLALTGAWTEPETGLMGTIVLEMGGSSDLCAILKPGEPVILMGPTGEPTETPPGETVVLAGGGLGNAVLFSIGRALRAAGSRVLYFAGYKRAIDRYKVAEIEAAADTVIWACDEDPGFTPGRPQDKAFVGNIVAAMVAYQTGALGDKTIDLGEVDRIIAIGSDRMMQAVALARHGALAPWMKPTHRAIGSINSPMQCMMKEICAQCLQPHRDPVSGRETVVFSCFNQDQPLDTVDFRALHERLSQNAVQEKLGALWIDRCLVSGGFRPASRFLPQAAE